MLNVECLLFEFTSNFCVNLRYLRETKKTMKLIIRNSTNPYFNIAAEEHFLKNYDDDIIMFWQSSHSVIIGKHQNTMAEVDINFINKNKIPVIRRISGGGTVYHDYGNINYTIIRSLENREKLVDFVEFTKPIIIFLSSLGLKAVYEGKNNLTINGKKFSGNSAHVFKNRILNHGTILFNTNLDNLEAAISPLNYKIKDKSVRSIRANVANIAPQLPQSISIDVFMEKLINYYKNYFNIELISQISDIDTVKITELVETKYKLWDWNYGYSPSYSFNNEYNGNTLSMKIKKGVITNISLNCDVLYDIQISSSLLNKKYDHDAIKEILSKYDLNTKVFNAYLVLFGI